VDAIVLAGGSPDDPLAQRYGVASKTLVPVRGRPMVAYTLEALRATPDVDRIVYVGPVPAQGLEPAPDVVLPDQGSMLANLESALAEAESPRVVVASGDNPFITPEAVRDLLRGAPEAALVYPIVPREAVEARWPGMRRTYARLRDGVFTGGNLILLDKALFVRALPMARKIVALRKKPLALAGTVGWGVLLKLLLGRLAIADVERRAEQLFGLPMRAYVTRFAEIGVDADSEEDIRWFEEEETRANGA
jgi:molybdopterin-guanine dinucleotide biosynthesis protein A